MRISKFKALTSKEYALIEELVIWGTKIKDINWIIGLPKTELYAKNYYKKLGLRPPNGLPGTATAKTVRLEKKMQYFALAVRYKNLLIEGVNRNDAMLSVYRLHWNEYGSDEVQNVKPSTWFSTSKRIDCGVEHVITCTTCGGRYILCVDTVQDPKDRCVWCNHILSKHIFRKDTKTDVLLDR
jgi:hypothetical protein